MDDEVLRYMSKFTFDLESRLYMPRDGYPSLENCHRSPSTRAVIKTVWNFDNRGHKVLKCTKPKGEACTFSVWMDGPIHGRAKEVIDFLYATVVEVTQENTVYGYTFKCMEEEILSLQRENKKNSFVPSSN